jgi:hypothetical protein
VSILAVILCAIAATTCAIALVGRWPTIQPLWAATGLLVAIAVGGYTALQLNADALWRRADAVCIGRGGVAVTVVARHKQPRVYCRDGNANGYGF